MLRKIRIAFALLCFVLITLLFLDFTGTLHTYFGWLAKIQFLPALLALNVGVVAGLIVLTLLFGRVYCSVICPLGVMQDVFGWFGKKARKSRYAYSPAKSRLRYIVLALFVVALVAGIGAFVALLAPYSAYGRIASNLFAPLWQWGNNVLAYFAERFGSYAFYTTEVWIRSLPVFIVAAVTFAVLGVLAWRNGRTYCNAVCPVGTVLSFFARFAWFKPTLDAGKCVGCRLCERNCKAACIDVRNHRIDYSRCVGCMDCIDQCNKGAITFKHTGKAVRSAVEAAGAGQGQPVDTARRSFVTGLGVLAATSAIKAQEKQVDGGLAAIIDKQRPQRQTPIVPPGAQGLRHLAQHCTACQLCVSVCPNGVLRPSTDMETLMQPESSYERGYCRPECTKCSDVCPAGAIRKITVAEKSSIQIGHAVWVAKNC
ncbi:MAG: 4Fe-4S binding protein, partial [Bacteroidales bacterium]|nr:4Fe-4S binding protein [Bacteroidales bacterium]